MSNLVASNLLRKWVSAVKSGDPKQVTNLYRDDGILLGTFSKKERVGRELILEYFEKLLKSPVDVEVVSENPHIFEPCDAVNSGHYNFVTNGKTINARFSFVYHLDDDWKIVSHHSSIMPET